MRNRWLSIGLVVLGLAALSARSAQKPNVLFIAIDDLRPELGCYGATEIKTPAIDALAKSGLRFDRAYCQMAVCNPSRVSLLTGMRPDSTKVWDLVTRFRHTAADVVTLPQHFKNRGYHTAAIGKIVRHGRRWITAALPSRRRPSGNRSCGAARPRWRRRATCLRCR